MTRPLKSSKKPLFSGTINIMTALSAHLPCCGSQIFMTVFGAQTLGALSTSYLYQFQFVTPLIVSALLAAGMMLWHWWHNRQHTHTPHSYSKATDIRQFFIINLVIGYVVTALLYLFVPPHKHHVIDTHTTGYRTNDGQAVFAEYHDNKRHWPWSKRLFIARADQNPTAAQELFWYDLLSRRALEQAQPVTVHLYARPVGMWLNGGAQTTRPLQFYIALEKPDEIILGQLQAAPALVLFYRQDCAPCQVDINLIPSLQKIIAPAPIAVVSLTSVDDLLREKTSAYGVQLIDASLQDTHAVLDAFSEGTQPIALPFSIAVNKKGETCARHTGLLGLAVTQDWRDRCLK